MILSDWGESILDLFFPRRCVQCLAIGRWLCEECTSAVKNKLWFEPVATDIFGLYLLDEPIIREMIHALKYNGVRELATVFGEVLSSSCRPEEFCLAAGIDKSPTVIPVPLGRKRLAKRGYNQAELLARVFAIWLGCPLETRCLARRAGKTVVGQGRVARQRQAMEQFYVQNEQIIDKNTQYILIDDVITTGSTLQICRQLLLEQGIGSVKGVGFARKLA